MIRKVRKKPEKTSEFEDLGEKNTSKTPKFGDLGKEKIPRYSFWRVRRGGKSIKYAGFSELHREIDRSGEAIWGIWVKKKSIKNAGWLKKKWEKWGKMRRNAQKLCKNCKKLRKRR